MTAFLPPLPLRQANLLKAKRNSSQCTTISPCALSTPPNSIQSLAEHLSKQLPSLFSPSSPDSHYDLYDPSVTFEDPLNKFTGIQRYKNNISFLNNSPVFTDANLTLYDTRIINETTVRTRWALSMTANLPWKPCVSFTGQSDYIIRPDNSLVIRHVDIWDSLLHNEFFSFQAVVDLVKQCAPGTVSPSLLGGFQLLRRTATMQIRQYVKQHGVLLSRLAGEKWIVDDGESEKEQTNVSLVAVSKLSASPTASQLAETKKNLKREIDDVPYAQAGERFFYVVFDEGDMQVHEVWLELESAHVYVE